MADTVNALYAQQYSENIMELAQQKGSKLLNSTYIKTNVRGKNFFQDQIGEWTMSAKTGRNPVTPSSDPNVARRMAIMADYHDNVLLDRSDELKIISDPKSVYTQSAGYSIGRKYDAVIKDGLGGTAKSGETGSTSVTLPSSNIIAEASSGMTFAKVKTANRKLDDNDVPKEDRFMVTSPAGIEDLLGEATATSSDYASLNAIQNGGFDGKTWMGFQWIMSTQLDVTASVRQCFAYQKMGICTGLAMLPYVRTSERADLSYSWQVYYEISVGVVRLEEDRVIRVDIRE